MHDPLYDGLNAGMALREARKAGVADEDLEAAAKAALMLLEEGEPNQKIYPENRAGRRARERATRKKGNA